MANPHYLPEICIKVTVINFTVTLGGLEDQLAAEVITHERSDLATLRADLVVQIAADRSEMDRSPLGKIMATPHLESEMPHSLDSAHTVTESMQHGTVWEGVGADCAECTCSEGCGIIWGALGIVTCPQGWSS
eukprot:5527648-Amphidinium_carterae.1